MAGSRTPVLSLMIKLSLAVVTGVLTLLVGGFLYFSMVATAAPEEPDASTDVIVVLTGGTGRIDEGFNLLAQKRARAMLITGVHPGVMLGDLLGRWPGSARDKMALDKHCCIFLEHVAATTEDNAAETRGWLNRNGGPQNISMRLVTSDYHMPRALLLFRRAIPEADIKPWPVASGDHGSSSFWRMMGLEYGKTILTWIGKS